MCFWPCSLFSCSIGDNIWHVSSTCNKESARELSIIQCWNTDSYLATDPLSGGSWQDQIYKLDCKLACGSIHRGNGISLRSVCCSQIKHSSRYHVFWVWCYQRIGGMENEIRRRAKESWTSWMTAQQRQEASRCDSTIRSCCTAISQPSSCQLSTMQDANTHFIFMAFHAHRNSHRQTLAASRQIYSSPWVLSAVCIKGWCAIGKRVRRLG